MKLEEKIKKIQKNTEKKLKDEKSYQEMKKAFLILEEAGISKEPTYNLQTIESMGKSIPVFTDLKTE